MSPIITYEETEFLLNMGVISSVADHCEMKWNENHFLPMMQWQRRFLPESEQRGYHITVIGVMHGFAQGYTDSWFKDNDLMCEEAIRVLDGKLFDEYFDYTQSDSK